MNGEPELGAATQLIDLAVMVVPARGGNGPKLVIVDKRNRRALVRLSLAEAARLGITVRARVVAAGLNYTAAELGTSEGGERP